MTVKVNPNKTRRRFTARIIRNNLGRWGLRGALLKQEVKRILAGPTIPHVHQLDVPVTYYPFGWSRNNMTRHMKRLFYRSGGLETIIQETLPQRRRSVIFIGKHYHDISKGIANSK